MWTILLIQLLVTTPTFTNAFRLKWAKSSSLLLSMSSTSSKLNPRDERRRILKTDNYNRMGFKEEKAMVEEMMSKEFTSPLVKEMRANNGRIQRGDVTVKLAEFYGFCWGVERAIAMAYEARSHFPDKTIHITNEIIHNPEVMNIIIYVIVTIDNIIIANNLEGK